MENENYLLLMDKVTDEAFYAIRCEDGFRIITVNDALTNEVEETLLNSVCTNGLLDELGLVYRFFPFSFVKSVAFDDTNLVFHTREKTYSYHVFGDCDVRQMTSFFNGVTRVELTNKKKKVKEDWRIKQQNPAVVKRLGYINAFFCVAVIACAFLQISNAGGLVSLASALIWITAVVLCVTLPQYFSPLEKRQRKHFGYTTSTVSLALPLVVSPLSLAMGFIREFALVKPSGYLWFLAMAVVATASFILVMHMQLRDFREHFGVVFAVLCISVFFFYGAAGYINHYANFGKEYKDCTVVELRMTQGSKSAYYYCIVELPNGKELECSISGDAYYALYEGATVPVYSGSGALGVKYVHIKVD